MDLQAILDRVKSAVAPAIGTGRVADYIPALARVDPRQFGIAIAMVDGATVASGDADVPFSIQSISKVFTLTLALGRHGNDVWRRVGREPSGSAFNSIVQLEREKGIPRNPLINAGAIVIADMLLARGSPASTIQDVLGFVRRLSGDDAAAVDPEVAASEAATGYRNVSLANFLKGFGNLEGSVADVLEVYFAQCSIAMSCRTLARAGLFLAADGRSGVSGARIVSTARARRVKALMLTCGHYDASGDFAYRVGLPGKSGVGGGILAVAPHQASIAVWSPGLNANGNSLVGTLVLERLVEETGWSVF